MIPRLLIILGIAALIVACALAATNPVGAAGRPTRCVGTVVRVIEPGVEIVKRRDGTLCQRPAQARPVRARRGR